MKELERAFGVYVSWNCARLNSGDYVIVYTRSHDMSADIYTKGFNDAGLFSRLCLLTNLYSPMQWSSGLLRPAPLLADKSAANLSPDSDSSVVNSQWPILVLGPSSRPEDNRKPIKKKNKKETKRMLGIIMPKCWWI